MVIYRARCDRRHTTIRDEFLKISESISGEGKGQSVYSAHVRTSFAHSGASSSLSLGEMGVMAFHECAAQYGAIAGTVPNTVP